MKNLQRITGYICIFFGAFLVVYLRFNNPELPETKLFIEFYYFWFFAIALIIGGYLISFKFNL